MADKNTNKCAHPSCVCRAAKDSKFCSAFCEGATDKPDVTCNCGHAACTAKENAAAARGMGQTFNY